MYLAHFNLAESPFSITPDPRFVYLSGRHREALAHLLYGFGEGGGFVQLTGEVGTGKTTICRTLLRQLPDRVDVALIFNPQLTVTELLESLCDELDIERPGHGLSIKALVDRLYAYLLDANARGRRTVLIIDEAQNLSGELLEEVRLLTNLETDDSKLLQVFLIGQPELRSKLASENLRQLAQRITARYHLEPLSLDETRLYIRHRLAVAGCTREIFSSPAVRSVHRLSGGIPRRVNILCDRALLGAYATDAERVSASIVRKARFEIEGESRRRYARPAALGFAAVVALTLGGFALEPGRPTLHGWFERAGALVGVAPPAGAAPAARVSGVTAPDPQDNAERVARVEPMKPGEPVPPTPQPPAETSIAVHPAEDLPEPAAIIEATTAEAIAPAAAAGTVTAAPVPSPPSAPPAPTFQAVIAALDDDGWSEAVQGLALKWGIAPPSTDSELCDWATDAGLACYTETASWDGLRALDLPAVLRLDRPGDAGVYALLTRQSDDGATLEIAGHAQPVTRADLESIWNGEYLLLWRPPFESLRPVRLGHRGERVGWVRNALAALDGIEPPTGRTRAAFDAPLRERVMAFQRERGLMVDGMVGPQTFLHLSPASAAVGTPSLAADVNDAEVSVAPGGALAMGTR